MSSCWTTYLKHYRNLLLIKKRYHYAKIGVWKHCGRENLLILNCRMILQDHVAEFSRHLVVDEMSHLVSNQTTKLGGNKHW